MTPNKPDGPSRQPDPQRPWYREPWPWVAIGIPAVAVVGGLFTLYLAITHPDPLVIDSGQYEQIHSQLHAQPAADVTPPAAEPARDTEDGDD